MSRRQFLRVGGASLCGLSMLDLLAARGKAASGKPRAKHLICCWLAGGPPHLDMFDMKPDVPSNRRSEFKPIKTNVPGLEVGELLPNLARLADKYTIIRSVSTLNKPGNHGEAPYYWLTGNPRRPSGTEEYPSYGSVVAKLRPGPADLPTCATLGVLDWTTQNAIGNSFLGPAYAPFVFDPVRAKDAMTAMLTPQHDLPAFERNADFLRAIDTGLRRIDGQDELIAGLDQHQQTAFNILRSPKLRQAVDLTGEPVQALERYKRLVPSKPRFDEGNPLHFLLARRLVEAGVPVVHFNFGYWDWHSDLYPSGRRIIPSFDAGLALLLDDLDQRGLLDSTIVLALGEMGRIPGGNSSSHSDHAQFVLAAGGGFKGGNVVGATDKLGDRVADKFYKIESFGRTLYHLLGIDPDTVVTTPANRPIKLIAEEAPIIQEAIA
ncbi:hypothetical protein AYO44_18765 [Planctomycetaceae bacterium SCGC AG-212-F19]|nr:hypothetical protein AYO44_18765 [Planctomycetaceae bacterium SCGC AG-212-F19]